MSLTVNHHLVMFGDHWSLGSGNTTYLICHHKTRWLKDHVTLWVQTLSPHPKSLRSCDFVGANPKSPTLSPHTANFDVHKHCNSEDISFLICRVISEEHMIKALFNLMVGSPSCYVTTLPSLVTIDIVLVEI